MPFGRHLPPTVLLAGLAVLHTWPLAVRLDDALPGRGLGDNLSGLWNVWWMREALASSALSFFQTPHLFAPAGTPLVLHAHMAPSAFAGATLLAGLSTPAALNLLLIAAVFLNGVTAYALAYDVTRRAGAALLAGVLFMLAPPLLARMMGHFNLVHAWTLVLAVWLMLRMRSTAGAIAGGAALALVAWTDYYLFVYAAGVLATLAVARHWSVRIICHVGRGVRRSTILAAIVLAFTAVLAGAAAVVILITGGGELQVGGMQVSMRTAENPLMAMWICGVIAALIRWPIRLRLSRRAAGAVAWWPHVRVAVLVFLAGVAPLAWMAAELWLGGGYATQQSSWRTAPRGVDLATLVLGPPFHPLVGDGVRGTYAWAGIDVMESSAWLGVTACVLAGVALASKALRADVRPWRSVAAVFGIWALGPFLTVAGFNTWLILPQAVLRYLPAVGNARMPSRALIVVSLAMAMMAAIWAARRRGRVVAVLVALVALEMAGAPLPVASLGVPSIYQALAIQPDGAVLELPLGFRDGFGEVGDFDDRTLLYQTVHRHPMAGGFVARLSPAVRREYERHPVLKPLLDGTALPPCEQAVSALIASGFRYVVIDRARLATGLATDIGQWPLTPIAADQGREAFQLRSGCGPNQAPGR